MDALSLFAPIDPADAQRAALVSPSVTWTFADLALSASALVRRLQARGLGSGARAALRASSSPETFLAIHALASLGVTIVPIHPRLSPAEVRVVLDVTRPDRVLEEAELTLPSPEEIHAAGAPPFLSGTAESLSLSDTAESLSLSGTAAAPFAIVCTSGTTGRPKGAVLSRRAFLAAAVASAQNLGWEDRDRWLLCMPLAHVGGLSIVTRCLVARRTVVMLPRFDPRLVLDAIRAYDVTLLSVVPAMLHALLDADHEGVLQRLRALLLGGAAAPASLLDACAHRGVRALTTYGLTEACSQVTSQAPRDPSIRRAGSGAPLPGLEIRIAPEASPAIAPPAPVAASTPAAASAAAAPGTVGRILVRGPSLFDGYLRPDGSVDPALSADGFFDTGDLGEIDEEGQLRVHARRTDLIVTGGENVYPVEVEQALERLPGVRRAAVFGVPDERWGQIVAAAIEPDPAAPHDIKSLIDVLSTTLAAHKRPRRWAFVETLPLTPSGKLLRAGLADLYGPVLRSSG